MAVSEASMPAGADYIAWRIREVLTKAEQEGHFHLVLLRNRLVEEFDRECPEALREWLWQERHTWVYQQLHRFVRASRRSRHDNRAAELRKALDDANATGRWVPLKWNADIRLDEDGTMAPLHTLTGLELRRASKLYCATGRSHLLMAVQLRVLAEWAGDARIEEVMTPEEVEEITASVDFEF